MLDRYVYLVKNLRGVLAVSEGDELGGVVAWLSRRFRYRDLGVPQCLVEREPRVFEGRLEGSPFHVLGYPTEKVGRAARVVLGVLQERLDPCLTESLLLAASYASPLHLTPSAISVLEEAGLLAHLFKGKPMDDRMAKLHLRIVDYSVLDYYLETIRDAVECIEDPGCSGGELRRRRAEQARRDEKRYWRLRGGSEPLVAYIDYASLLVDTPLAEKLTGAEERVLLPLLAGINLGARRS